MNLSNFNLDHLGVASAGTFQQLFEQTGDKRKRKTALKLIAAWLKQTGGLPQDAQVEYISLAVDKAGQIWHQVAWNLSKPAHGVED